MDYYFISIFISTYFISNISSNSLIISIVIIDYSVQCISVSCSIVCVRARAELGLFVREVKINITRYNIYFNLLYISCKTKLA